MPNDWYDIENVEQIDTPALAVYPSRIARNISFVKEMAGNRLEKLRPHIKTNKTPEVCEMMLKAGITKFKCATIAEAEVLGMLNAPDVLLAYQPVGPKVQRLMSLVKAYPSSRFSCLVDSVSATDEIARAVAHSHTVLDVFIDLNVGMNRTGVKYDDMEPLISKINTSESLRLRGIHAYDGHIHEENVDLREKACQETYQKACQVLEKTSKVANRPLDLVIGGTLTFSTHIKNDHVECSPGTFIFWDYGYGQLLKDLPFVYAALVLCRVISVIDEAHICVDLGYKSVASEGPLPRVHFLNAPEAQAISQSEEHLVVKVKRDSRLSIGDVLYGVPTHICPTVSLYDRASVIVDGQRVNEWKVLGRSRFIKH